MSDGAISPRATQEKKPLKRRRSISQQGPRKAANKSTSVVRNIPQTYAECDEADKMLLKMREEGEPWVAIKEAWEAITGTEVARSTLPNRYIRLLDNFAAIDPDDHPRLLQSKREVDLAFEQIKWKKVAEGIEQKGGARYEPDVLQRVYRKMMLDGGLEIPSAILDSDFGILVETPQTEKKSKNRSKRRVIGSVNGDADGASDVDEGSENEAYIENDTASDDE